MVYFFSIQLLCKTPSRRLRNLERFQRQTFFQGTTFDLALLQRQPVEVTHKCSETDGFGCETLEERWTFPHSSRRWFCSCERGQIAPPKLGEASRCPCSLSRASTTTRSSARPPRRTHTWIPAYKLERPRRCQAQHSHCSLLRKKANTERCLCDRVYSTVTDPPEVTAHMFLSLHTYSPLHTSVVRLLRLVIFWKPSADYDLIRSIVKR